MTRATRVTVSYYIVVLALYYPVLRAGWAHVFPW